LTVGLPAGVGARDGGEHGGTCGEDQELVHIFVGIMVRYEK
jgi:hypothetical protein